MDKTSWTYSIFQPENVVCTARDSNSLKIIDFGLAKKLAPQEKVRRERIRKGKIKNEKKDKEKNKKKIKKRK